MKKFMKGSLIFTTALMFGLVSVFGNIATTNNSAKADVSGAAGNAPYSGGGGGNAHWQMVGSINGGDGNAWPAMYGGNRNNRNIFYNKVKSDSGSAYLAQYCLDSSVILYKKSNHPGPGRYATSSGPLSSWGITSDVANAVVRLGFQNYNYIVCLKKSDLGLPTKTWTTTENYNINQNESLDVTDPYSWTTEVKPQYITDKNGVQSTSDIIGKNNLHSQVNSVNSNFSHVWDQVNNSSNKYDVPTIQNMINAALEKDKSLSHSKVNLDAKNKAGMAEGGILNVTERTKSARIVASDTLVIPTTRTCNWTQTWNYDTGNYNSPTSSCSENRHNESAYRTNVNNTTQIQTPKVTNFYQMLSVHCNQEQFNNLINSDSSITVVNSGDSSKKISAVAYTRNYTSVPSVLEFGDRNNSNLAQKATSSIGFFDKECPYDCTPSSNTSDGASTSNGATTNVNPNGTNSDNTKKGATAANTTGSNSNYFEFFRDNQPQKISINSWYPKSEGVVSYNGDAAKSTTVTRWSKGTPDVKISNGGGGQFTMKTADGKNTLFTGNESPATQKDWSVDTFSNSITTILDGFYKDFTVQSTWSSDNGFPEVLNFKWEYQPNVSTNVYTNSVGFGAGGAQNVGTTSTISTPIDGKCYANFGTSNSQDTTKIFQDNTGSGTTNNVDGGLVNGDPSTSNPIDTITNLVVKFVRSTTN